MFYGWECNELGILCGVDIIEIDRIKKSMDTLGDAFRNRVFTQKEILYCETRKAAKYKSYAARFAAKEAVSKALGTGISRGIGWTDIEVLNDENGKPYIILSGKAQEILLNLGGECISISMSHSENYSVAYAVIQTKNRA